MSIATARASINDAFAGIDGSAVVVIAIVALINTIRRSSLSGVVTVLALRTASMIHRPI